MGIATEMPFVCLAIAGTCNLSCRYCPQTGDGCAHADDHMTYALTCRVLNALERYGIKEIRLSGREPLLHPRIQSVIDCCLQLDFNQVRINTNGTLPIHSLLQFASDRFVVIIKLDTVDPAVDSWLHGHAVSGTALSNIETCIDNDVRTRVNTVITVSTQETLHDLTLSLLKYPLRHKLLQLEYYPDIIQFYDQEIVRTCSVPFPFPGRIVKRYSYRAEMGYGLDSAVYDSGYTLSKISDEFGSARYASFCRDCGLYPCQEGLYHIYCSQFGTFRPCKKCGPEFVPSDKESEDAILHALDDAVQAAITDVHFAKGTNCLSLPRSPHAGRGTKAVLHAKQT